MFENEYDKFDLDTTREINEEITPVEINNKNGDKIQDAMTKALVGAIEIFPLWFIRLFVTFIFTILTLLVLWFIVIAYFSTVTGYNEGITTILFLNDFKPNISAYEAQKIISYPATLIIGYVFFKRKYTK